MSDISTTSLSVAWGECGWEKLPFNYIGVDGEDMVWDNLNLDDLQNCSYRNFI